MEMPAHGHNTFVYDLDQGSQTQIIEVHQETRLWVGRGCTNYSTKSCTKNLVSKPYDVEVKLATLCAIW